MWASTYLEEGDDESRSETLVANRSVMVLAHARRRHLADSRALPLQQMPPRDRGPLGLRRSDEGKGLCLLDIGRTHANELLGMLERFGRQFMAG